MMTSRLIRLVLAAFAGLVSAAVLKALLVDAGLQQETGFGTVLKNALLEAFVSGLPCALALAATTELLRLRRLDVQIGIGTALCFVVAWLAVRGEPPESIVFDGGLLSGLALAAIGAVSSAVYWGIAGRAAGWRGEAEERMERLAAEAFQRASAGAVVRPCHKCLAIALGIGLTAFILVSWGLIEAGGLRKRIAADTEHHGRAALADGGFGWASFEVVEGRGVVGGEAPDELEKRRACDLVRETLRSVTGLPGVIRKIEDRATARVAVDSVSQQLAEAARREQEARRAIQEARLATEAAREAAREAAATAKRTAEEHAAAEAERDRVLAEQRLAEAARLEQQRLEEAQRAAEQSRRLELERREQEAIAEARLEEEARRKAAEAAKAHDEAVAAAEAQATAARTEEEGDPPAPDAAAAGASDCTLQDVALVETSQIHFEPHSFDLGPSESAELDRAASSIKVCSSRPIEISGFADANADRLFNPALALQRADAVREALVARGVSEKQIVTKFTPPGLSATIDAPSERRASFRRVELKFLEAAALTRDATQGPDERATNCQDDLSRIMASSIIHFGTGKAHISPESIGLIIRLATAIQTCGSVIVTIEGHTDRLGLPSRNQKLSEERANSVRDALIAAGVDPTRLATQGFASSRPYDPTETAEAHALNRRIEFRVSGKFTSTNAGGP